MYQVLCYAHRYKSHAFSHPMTPKTARQYPGVPKHSPIGPGGVGTQYYVFVLAHTLVSKDDIDHWNLLFRISGTFENGLKHKNPYDLRSKSHVSSRTET